MIVDRKDSSELMSGKIAIPFYLKVELLALFVCIFSIHFLCQFLHLSNQLLLRKVDICNH